jgi:hypothetical protein
MIVKNENTGIVIKPVKKKAQLTINDNVLSVTGEQVKNVKVYNLQGQLLAEQNRSFTFSLPHSGCYLTTVLYDDDEMETQKVLFSQPAK